MNGALYKGSDDNVLNVKFAKTEQKGPPQAFLKKVCPGFSLLSSLHDLLFEQAGQMNYAYNNGSYGMGTYRGGGPGPLRGHSFMGRYSPMMSQGYVLPNLPYAPLVFKSLFSRGRIGRG